MSFQRKDRFFHKAKKEGFLARSAYKLEELQKKYHLIRQGEFVVDLGASPGAWSQVAIKAVGARGLVVGLDLKPVQYQAPNAKFYVMDVFEIDTAIFEGRPVDVLMSDMAPNTTGVRSVDQARSKELCLKVIELADTHLKNGGHLVMKLFEGPGVEDVVKEIKSRFSSMKRIKPEAVRKGSFETYILGFSKKPTR